MSQLEESQFALVQRSILLFMPWFSWKPWGYVVSGTFWFFSEKLSQLTISLNHETYSGAMYLVHGGPLPPIFNTARIDIDNPGANNEMVYAIKTTGTVLRGNNDKCFHCYFSFSLLSSSRSGRRDNSHSCQCQCNLQSARQYNAGDIYVPVVKFHQNRLSVILEIGNINIELIQLSYV